MKINDPRYILYRQRALPDQLDRARRRVAQLEREALSLGMKELLREGSAPQGSPSTLSL